MFHMNVNKLPLRLVDRNLTVGNVAFISGDDNWRVLRQIHLELFHPLGDFAPRLEVSNVVHYQCTYKYRIGYNTLKGQDNRNLMTE